MTVTDAAKEPAMTLALKRGNLNLIKIIKEKQRGEAVNVRGRNGVTPLMYAAGKSSLEVVNILLSKHVFDDDPDITATDDSGRIYNRGEGVEQDYQEAVKWYRLSAEQEIARAQVNLGYMYGNGYGVEQDYAEALKWYCLAAEQGYASEQCNLGVMYSKGDGVTQDKAEAFKWYRLAAEQGHQKAKETLEKLGC